MLERRPPFVPRCRDWEDTKYFDEDCISDIESGTSEDDGCENVQPGLNKDNGRVDMPAEPDVSSKASQHHHEDQHIVPSTALEFDACQNVLTVKTPDAEEAAALPVDGTSVEPTGGEDASPMAKKKTKEKKRPRDIILRDPATGRMAMRMREQGAFLGYAYRKPKGLEEIVADVMVKEQEERMASSPPLGYWTQALPREEIC
jgi:hypothetical protein